MAGRTRARARQRTCCLPGSPPPTQLWCMKASAQQTLSACAASIHRFRATTIPTPCLSKVPHHTDTDCETNAGCSQTRHCSPAPGRGKRHLLKTGLKINGLPSFQFSMQQWQEMWPLPPPTAATFRRGCTSCTAARILKQVGPRQGCSIWNTLANRTDKGRILDRYDGCRHTWVTDTVQQHQFGGRT